MKRLQTYLQLLLHDIPSYSLMGIIKLILIHIKYTNLLLCSSLHCKSFSAATRLLHETSDALRERLCAFENIGRDNLRRQLFERSSRELIGYITTLITIIENMENRKKAHPAQNTFV